AVFEVGSDAPVLSNRRGTAERTLEVRQRLPLIVIQLVAVAVVVGLHRIQCPQRARRRQEREHLRLGVRNAVLRIHIEGNLTRQQTYAARLTRGRRRSEERRVGKERKATRAEDSF